MAGPFTDNDAVKFDQSVKTFEDATGIDIVYSGSKEIRGSDPYSGEGGSVLTLSTSRNLVCWRASCSRSRVVDLNRSSVLTG